MVFQCISGVRNLVFFSVFIFSEITLATPINNSRCASWGDSLEQGEQVGIRYEYAKRCEANLQLQKEIDKVFEDGISHDGIASPTKGYPIYGRFSPNSPQDRDPWKNPSNWFAPKDQSRANEGCNSRVRDDGLKPAGYKIFAFCASGCYTPEQAILVDPVSNQTMSAVEVYNSKHPQVASVDPSSTLGQVRLKTSLLNHFITDLKETDQTILHFKTLSGGELRVTENHPLVNDSGEMLSADRFLVGNGLVKADGSIDPIVEIVKESYYGKVYNFDSEAEADADRIFVAQGFLNGSLHFQNESVKRINRMILRTNIAEDLISEYSSNP